MSIFQSFVIRFIPEAISIRQKFSSKSFCDTVYREIQDTGKSKKVRVIGGFELSRVKLVRKLPGGESKKVRVSGRFELLGFNCIFSTFIKTVGLP